MGEVHAGVGPALRSPLHRLPHHVLHRSRRKRRDSLALHRPALHVLPGLNEIVYFDETKELHLQVVRAT